MTDDAKAVEIARNLVANNWPPVFQVVELAKAFLALSEKCRRYEAVVEAAREFTEDRKGKTGMLMGGRSVFFADKMRIALSALEPGDSDG